jgi:hypothetical protein
MKRKLFIAFCIIFPLVFLGALVSTKPTPMSASMQTKTSSTLEPSTTPTKQQMVAAVVPPATPVGQVVVPGSKLERKMEKPAIQRILWPEFAFIGLLAVLASASLSDRRPWELRALARSLDAIREIQKSYPSED